MLRLICGPPVSISCNWSACFVFDYFYTPDIYAEGYRISVRIFVRYSVTTTNFMVKVSPMVYISVTADQKAFIFGT